MTDVGQRAKRVKNHAFINLRYVQPKPGDNIHPNWKTANQLLANLQNSIAEGLKRDSGTEATEDEGNTRGRTSTLAHGTHTPGTKASRSASQSSASSTGSTHASPGSSRPHSASSEGPPMSKEDTTALANSLLQGVKSVKRSRNHTDNPQDNLFAADIPTKKPLPGPPGDIKAEDTTTKAKQGARLADLAGPAIPVTRYSTLARLPVYAQPTTQSQRLGTLAANINITTVGHQRELTDGHWLELSKPTKRSYLTGDSTQADKAYIMFWSQADGEEAPYLILNPRVALGTRVSSPEDLTDNSPPRKTPRIESFTPKTDTGPLPSIPMSPRADIELQSDNQDDDDDLESDDSTADLLEDPPIGPRHTPVENDDQETLEVKTEPEARTSANTDQDNQASTVAEGNQYAEAPKQPDKDKQNSGLAPSPQPLSAPLPLAIAAVGTTHNISIADDIQDILRYNAKLLGKRYPDNTDVSTKVIAYLLPTDPTECTHPQLSTQDSAVLLKYFTEMGRETEAWMDAKLLMGALAPAPTLPDDRVNTKGWWFVEATARLKDFAGRRYHGPTTTADTTGADTTQADMARTLLDPFFATW